MAGRQEVDWHESPQHRIPLRSVGSIGASGVFIIRGAGESVDTPRVW
jgi:hypothetical protein